jgi:O-antigen/teichoic acid export membrane protein
VIATAMLANAGGAALGFALIVLVTPTAEAFLTGVLIGSGAASLLGAVWVLRDGPVVRSTGLLIGGLRIGLPTVPHSLAMILASSGLVLVATWVGGVSVAGEMRLAMVFGTIPSFLVGAMNSAWAPLVYQTPPEGRGRVLEETATNLSRLIAVCAAGIVMLSPWLALWVAPEAYDRVAIAQAMSVLSLAGGFVVIYLSNVHLVFAKGTTWPLALTTPVSVMVGLGVGFAAGQAWGLPGVALGLPVIQAVNGLWTRLLARRLDTTRWSVKKAYLANLLPVGAGLVSMSLSPFSPVRAALAVMLAVVGLALLRRIGR